jgi:hypothetical protein
LTLALGRLAGEVALRAKLGQANRARALAEFDELAMIEAYRATYGAALGRSFP